MTITTAAKILGLSISMVRKMVHRRQLPAVKIETPQGYRWDIQADAVVERFNNPPRRGRPKLKA